MVLAGGVQRMDSSGTKIRGIPFFPFLLYVPESSSINMCSILEKIIFYEHKKFLIF